MTRPPAFDAPGRWFRGNLHTHSDRSDGVAPPEQVIGEYRAAGYDFLVLTDHFEARWDWTVTDTSGSRDDAFRRAAEAGAYNVLLHPGLTNHLDFDALPTRHLHAALLSALHEGVHYATQGPRIDDVEVDGDHVRVTCSAARAVALTGIHGWRSDVKISDVLHEATLDLGKLRSPYWRITVTDADGRRAWTNPVWT